MGGRVGVRAGADAPKAHYETNSKKGGDGQGELRQRDARRAIDQLVQQPPLRTKAGDQAKAKQAQADPRGGMGMPVGHENQPLQCRTGGIPSTDERIAKRERERVVRIEIA
jgi:hypothetical protein